MNSTPIVIPAKAGIQTLCFYKKTGFPHTLGMTEKKLRIFYLCDNSSAFSVSPF